MIRLTKSDTRNDLTVGPVSKKILFFALPILCGIILQSLYTTADAIIIGRYAGKEALASIESVFTLTKLPVNFFVGLSSGATIIVSQYFGAKNRKGLQEACHTALIFACVGGMILALTAMIISPFFIHWIRVPEAIAEDAHRYVLLFFSGMVPSLIYNIGAGIFRAVGDSKTPFVYLMIANGINVVLDIVFIAAMGLGVVGAGIATLVAQMVCAVGILIALMKTTLPCQISIKKLVLNASELKAFIKLGLPIGIQSTLYPISNTFIQTSINALGVNSIAAWAVCGKLDFLVWFVADAFCTTAATFVAQNYGAKQYERAAKGVRVSVIWSMVLVLLVGLVLYFFNRSLSAILIQDAVVIDIIATIMQLLAPLYVLYVLGAVLPGAIRGTGVSVKPMVITLFGACLTRIFWVVFIVPLQPTLIVVLTCYPVSWGVTSLMYWLYYIRYMKRLQKEQWLLVT